MRRCFMFAMTVALLCAALLFGCASDATPEQGSTTTTSTTSPPEPATEPLVIAVEADEADPFSFVLRAYAEFALWNLEAQHLNFAEWSTAFAQRQEEHDALLSRFSTQQQSMQNIRSRHVVYALYDINGDGVYELVFAYYSPDSDFYWPFAIYTTQDGIAVQQLHKALSDFGMELFPSGSVTLTGRDSPSGGIWTRIYRFVNGQLRFSTQLLASYGGFYQITDNEMGLEAWEGAPISEQEFDRIMAHYGIDREQQVELEWHPLFLPA